MQITLSPRRSPASLAGFMGAPSGPLMSVKPTTSAPSENILTPNGVPQTRTLGRGVMTARTVLTGSTPPMERVVW